jgi:hypothetical protein
MLEDVPRKNVRVPEGDAGERGWRDGEWVAGWTDVPFGSASGLEDDDPTVDARAVVMLPEFPGWRFFVTFSPAGRVVGFEVHADLMQPTTIRGQEAERTLSGLPRHPAAAPAITSRFLHKLPLGEIERVAKGGFMRVMSALKSTPELGERWGEAFKDVPRPGRAGRSDRDYAELAARYVATIDDKSPAPVADLAREMSLDEMTVRHLLTAARKRGLLTPAPPGRAGGELTDKAIQLLAVTASAAVTLDDFTQQEND